MQDPYYNPPEASCFRQVVSRVDIGSGDVVSGLGSVRLHFPPRPGNEFKDEYQINSAIARIANIHLHIYGISFACNPYRSSTYHR